MTREDYAMGLAQDRHDTDFDDLAEREQAEIEDAWDREHEARVDQRLAEIDARERVVMRGWSDVYDRVLGGEAS